MDVIRSWIFESDIVFNFPDYPPSQLLGLFHCGCFGINPDNGFGIRFPQVNPGIRKINFNSVDIGDLFRSEPLLPYFDNAPLNLVQQILVPDRQFGALPQTPITFLFWHKKVIKKSQGCIRFTRKTCAWQLKSFNSPVHSQQLTPTLLARVQTEKIF